MRLSRSVNEVVPPIVAAVVVIVVWEWSAYLFHIPKYLLPSPSMIYEAFVSPKFPWFPHVLATFSTAISGLILGAIGGLSLAVAMNLSKLFRRIAFPYIVASQLIPKVAIAPLLFVLLGFSDIPRIAIAFLITFFPMVINTSAGLNSASPEIFDVVRALKATSRQILLKVKLPSALPYIFSGLKVSVTLAIIGVIVSEFIYSNSGLGYLILFAEAQTDTTTIFVAVLILTFIGFSLFALVGLVERILLPWHRAPRISRGIVQ